VLLAAYKFEATLFSTRSPGFRNPEPDPGSHLTDRLNLTDMIRDEYRGRLNDLKTALGRLLIVQAEVRALFEPAYAEDIGKLADLAVRPILAAGTYFPSERSRVLNQQRTDEIPGLVDEHRELFRKLGEEDEISTGAKNALARIEKAFRPYLR